LQHQQTLVIQEPPALLPTFVLQHQQLRELRSLIEVQLPFSLPHLLWPGRLLYFSTEHQLPQLQHQRYSELLLQI
jgi:hypothetical protein